MGLTDLFSKFIVEHGSSEVQGKHIALFKDQLALADKKISELETENASLRSKLKNAETTVQKLTKENEKLRSKIQENENASHGNPLEEIKVKILMVLSKQEWIYAEHIARSLGIGVQVAQFHLDELQNNEMVLASYSMDDDEVWTLDHEGRRYLVRNNLIT
jgi:ribosomal protein S25